MEKIIAVMVCFNTAEQTRITLSRIAKDRNYDILVVNDGSQDRTQEYIERSGFDFICHPKNRGLGAAIKSGIGFALEKGYEVFVILAGNNKDDPGQIPNLLKPIVEEGVDYVQGSRFLEGGRFENPPRGRWVLIKLYVWLFKWMTGYRGTDPINGFRAYRLDIIKDPRIRIWQDWLDGYSFETYLLYKVLKSGRKVIEVPVSKSYFRPKKKTKYSHIKPLIGWWDIVKPLFYLKLKIKD